MKQNLLKTSQKQITFADARRIYQCNRRDADFGYGYPVEELSTIHGLGARKFWVLRDHTGMLACVSMSGEVK